VGRNTLPEPAVSSLLVVFLSQFRSALIYVLLAASLVSLALGAWSDALFIFAVLLLDAGIGATLEWRAETSAAALKKVLHLQPTVLRDGARREIDAADLAPGDVILLESGGAVPADLRLLSTHDLRIDESLLTGESAGVEKAAESVRASGTPLADRRNMAFAGSMVLAGRGTGVGLRDGPAGPAGRHRQGPGARPGPAAPAAADAGPVPSDRHRDGDRGGRAGAGQILRARRLPRCSA